MELPVQKNAPAPEDFDIPWFIADTQGFGSAFVSPGFPRSGIKELCFFPEAKIIF